MAMAMLASAEKGPDDSAMVRLGLVLSITSLPLIGVEMLSARPQEPLTLASSAENAVLACRLWQAREGTFTARMPTGKVQVGIRRCEADLDYPVILGRRFSVLAGAHYDRPLNRLHQPVAQRFPFLPDSSQTDGQ